MKTLIRAYLTLLKESREFDAIIGDLLLEMGIVPISRPQVGVRQAGVDIAAVGPGPDGRRTLFLLTIKRGDVNRGEWDGSGPQAVRPSLDEIQDNYLRSRVEPEYQALPKRIVLCCAGDLRQEAQEGWAGYTQRYTRPGDLDFELWNGDKFATLIDENLLNENALPPDARDDLRKAIALIADRDYDLSHGYRMLHRLLLEPFKDGPIEKAKARAKLKPLLRTATLCVSILTHWAADEGNLNNALLAAERAVLWGLEAMRVNDLTSDIDTLRELAAALEAYTRVLHQYVARMQAHYYVRDGLGAQTSEYTVLNEIVFHQLGVLALAAVSYALIAKQSNDQDHHTSFEACVDGLINLLENHPASAAPIYDGHVIDISLAMFALLSGDRRDVASKWIAELVTRVRHAFATKQHFPVASDSFDDAVALSYGQMEAEKVEEVRSMSWLLPTLAQWCVVLEREDLYKVLANEQDKAFKGVCFQLWHLDAESDQRLWVGTALGDGVSEAPIALPPSIADFKAYLADPKRTAHFVSTREIASAKVGASLLHFVACRHFRVPMSESYWLNPAAVDDLSPERRSARPNAH